MVDPPNTVPPLPPGSALPAPPGGALEPARPDLRADRRGSRVWIVGAIGVVVLLIVGITFAALVGGGGSELSMPDIVAGYERVAGPEVDDLVDSLKRDAVGQMPAEPVVGVYGTLVEPKFLVIAVAAAPPPGDPLAGMDPDLSGLGTSGSLDIAAATTVTAGDVTYTCVPYTMTSSLGGSVSADMCLWRAKDTFGFVVIIDPAVDGLELTPQVYEAVVA